MGVLADVLMVVFQNLADKLVFVVVYRFDNEPVVTGEVEERARFARGAKLRENVLLRQRQKIISRIKVEALLPQISEDPGRIILEFEIVLD
jgi:hypothetical protein